MLTDKELAFLEAAVEQAKETKRGLFGGERKTMKAEVAETILSIYAPILLKEIRELKRVARGEQ